jgi:hypothetical protein
MAGRHRKEQLGERIGIPIEIIRFDQYRMATQRLGDTLPCSVQGVSNFFHTFAVFMQEPDSNVPGKQNLSPSLVGAELLMLDACCGMHGEKDGIHVAFGNGFHEKKLFVVRYATRMALRKDSSGISAQSETIALPIIRSRALLTEAAYPLSIR